MIFEVWAPRATSIELSLPDSRRPLRRRDNGWWSVEAPEAGHGTDYRYFVDGEGPYPDPRSRRQPEGIFGPSRVYDHARFTWSDHEWKGRDLRGSIIYELHVGAFTAEGTFTAALDRLDHLVELGVDFVELMPVAPVPGGRNWGYDGVDLYAVNETYGGPDGLKELVDGCHRAGLGVILDVVYNHLGPSGNFLHPFGPYFAGYAGSFWGEAVNLDGPDSDEVRRYFIDNAVQWLRDYHIDGLRLDAVHALHDRRAVHLLAELAAEVDALACSVGRPLTLIAESDLNDPRMITPLEAGGLGMTAQWNDDVHHALHTAVSGERHGYYADFASMEALAKALTHGFVHDGGYSSFRGRSHGGPRPRRSRLPPGVLPAEPRPGRQQARGRQTAADRAEAGRGAPADLAVHAHAVHGRGVGRAHAVPVLHRPRRAGAARGGGRAQGPRVRGLRLRLDRARPLGRGHLPARQARMERAQGRGALVAAVLVPRSDRAAQGHARAHRSPSRPGAGRVRRDVEMADGTSVVTYRDGKFLSGFCDVDRSVGGRSAGL
ncbi:hypothetical protein GCM10020219_030270 [Nonomuraea dietziae]